MVVFGFGFLILFLNFFKIVDGQFGNGNGNPNANIFGGLSDLTRQFGFDLQQPGNAGNGQGFGFGQGPGQGFGFGNGPGPGQGPGRGRGQGMDIGGLINQFIAPSPQSQIPPHVFRRIIRFCRRHPEHPRCQGHPEWNQPIGQLPPNPLDFMGDRNLNLNDMFPDLINFKLPPIPKLNLPDLLQNVPEFLKNVVPPSILGQITEIAKSAIRATCASTGTCKQQRPEVLNQRATIAEQENIVQRLFNKGKSQTEVDQMIETRLARTQQVKKALLKNAGLDKDIEPANDGTFQKDILLTEEQANRMINEIEAGPTNMPNPGNGMPMGGRFGRSALFLESTPNQRWPNDRPIQYMFDQTLNEQDKQAVRAAINEIETKTCVRFKFETTKPPNSHLYYIKAAAGGVCGLSYIGKVEPVNPIYLTFACGNPTGVAIHETLHALGLNHEQLRGDRDQFIKINWENVNPQNYDFFAIADSKQFTSYGVKYDYGSIMHYNQFIASQFPTKPSMTAKINPTTNNVMMGQRNGLSTRDIEIITKMYCVPDCEDKNVYCGAWALGGYCTTPGQKGWMENNCQKSCNLC